MAKVMCGRLIACFWYLKRTTIILPKGFAVETLVWMYTRTHRTGHKRVGDSNVYLHTTRVDYVEGIFVFDWNSTHNHKQIANKYSIPIFPKTHTRTRYAWTYANTWIFGQFVPISHRPNVGVVCHVWAIVRTSVGVCVSVYTCRSMWVGGHHRSHHISCINVRSSEVNRK